MEILLMEKKYNLVQTLNKKIDEYTYVDKFNRPMYIRYEILKGNYFNLDVRTKKEKKNLSAPLLYNLYNVLETIKLGRTVVIVENEKIADYINKKYKIVACTTILNGIDTDNISDKMLELFRDSNVIILSYYKDSHEKLMDKLSAVTNSIRTINVNTNDGTDDTRQVHKLCRIMNEFKRIMDKGE
jgi:hypothetical protein